ncbi:hypothetical protein EZV62_011967 [Acer yangbiense]|uniref:Auxin-responsive protein n=1 Tax=Acer yangbiense TaxID=1000413 RepID=A0A5C7I623_9ROSI|nr:hypothetical protein EZV62_011967 [Acer yangbiense]
MVRKRQRQAAMGRVEGISLPRATAEVDVESYSKVSLAEKGHFVIYTFDRKRFVIPLAYLSNDICLELLKLSEEEFGLSSDEPITLPCDAAFMTCIVSQIKRGAAKGLDKAFLDSIITHHCTFSTTFPEELQSYGYVSNGMDSRMISAKKLIGMVRKRQRQAAMGGVKRISLPRASTAKVDVESCSKASLAEKGHFVVYTFDQKRFVIPLAYLNNDIFQELLKLSEEEFGLSSDEPITLPCNAAFMTCIVSLIKRGAAKGLDKAFLDSIITRSCTCSAAFPHEQQPLVNQLTL